MLLGHSSCAMDYQFRLDWLDGSPTPNISHLFFKVSTLVSLVTRPYLSRPPEKLADSWSLYSNGAYLCPRT
jgi:hypothetical protein